MNLGQMFNLIDLLSRQSELNLDDLRTINQIQVEVDCQWENIGEIANIIQDRIDYCRTISVIH